MSTTTDTVTAPNTADTKDACSETTMTATTTQSLSKFLIKVSEDMPTLDECYKFCNDPHEVVAQACTSSYNKYRFAIHPVRTRVRQQEFIK